MEMYATFEQIISGANGRCSCGRRHSAPEILLDIADRINPMQIEVIDRVAPSGTLLLVADTNTFEVLGEKVRQYLVQELGRKVRVCVLPSDPLLEPNGESLLEVFNSIDEEIVGLVGVGSGTINDIVKYAGTKARLEYIIHPTAPSMDGYVSGNAAILVRGIKRTLTPYVPPRAVLVDMNCVANAPKRMIAAGYADLVTKGISQADWILGRSALREYWCERSAGLVESSVNYCLSNAVSIGRADPTSVRNLLEGLLISGVSLQMAGSSRPGSGSEHIVAHFLEIMSLIDGENYDLHGIRVGLSGLAIMDMYHRLLELSAEEIEEHLRSESESDAVDREKRRAETIHSVYGPLSTEVLDIRRALGDDRARVVTQRERALAIAGSWKAICRELSSVLPKLDMLRESLADVGAAIKLSEASVSPERMRNALIYAKDMRDRYTILDLLDTLGLLEDFAGGAVRAIS